MSRLEASLLAIVFVTYAAGLVLPLAALVFQRERLELFGRLAAGVGLAAHTAALLARWVETGHAPIATPYENASTGAWSIVVLSFAAPAAWKLFRSVGIGALGLALVILGWSVTQDTAGGPLAPSLRSVWLYVHVFFAFLAYAAFSVASGASLAYLLRRAGRLPAADRLPSLEELDRVAYRYVVFGFITCAVMIASGAIWAKNLWGAYWSWDPLETWNLLAWLAYGVLIHLRVTYGWRDQRFAWFAMFAVLLVVIAYFGVGTILQGSMHVFTVPDAPVF